MENKGGAPTIKMRWHSYKSGARTRGIPFDIDFRDFQSMWQKPCSYCGTSIPTVGIDRVDNSRGYERGNIVPCCAICNKMKMVLDASMFIEHCRRVAKHMAENPLPDPSLYP